MNFELFFLIKNSFVITETTGGTIEEEVTIDTIGVMIEEGLQVGQKINFVDIIAFQ